MQKRGGLAQQTRGVSTPTPPQGAGPRWQVTSRGGFKAVAVVCSDKACLAFNLHPCIQARLLARCLRASGRLREPPLTPLAPRPLALNLQTAWVVEELAQRRVARNGASRAPNTLLGTTRARISFPCTASTMSSSGARTPRTCTRGALGLSAEASGGQLP